MPREHRFDAGGWSAVSALMFALALAAGSARADFNGRVSTVHDGDTISVAGKDRQERVRLFGIDAPERGQPYGGVARRALAARIMGRQVKIVEHGRDSYERVLGVVFLGAADVNAELVRQGHAWVFRRYSQDAAMLALEVEARMAKRGLWRDPKPIPPWEWRAREAKPVVPASSASPPHSAPTVAAP